MKPLSIAILLTIIGSAQAQTSTTNESHQSNPQWNEVIKTQQIKPGMSAELAIKLIGRKPDETEMVGAACGVFEVLTWHGEKARIVTMGGNVISRD